MILLTQASLRCGDHDVLSQTEAARARGWRVFELPEHLREYPELLEPALAQIPSFEVRSRALWVGFVPTLELYTQVYEGVLKRNIELLTTPEHHALIMELDRCYPMLADLTPATIAVRSLGEVKNGLVCINYVNISLLVSGLPQDDIDKYGRIK